MNGGDTFQLIGVADQHLWVVISDPALHPDVVLFVNLTSFDQFADQTVILEIGDHPFVQHRTCVNYPRARTAKRDDLLRLERAGKLRKSTPVSPQLLARLREGARTSQRIRTEHLQILVDQELIDP